MNNNLGNLGAALGVVLVILGVIILVAVVIAVCYLLTLHRALDKVSPRNRLMEPGAVWLSLIPCFNIIWAFFVASRVPDSLRNEFRDRGRDDGSDYGKGIATTNAVLGLISTFISIGSHAFPPEVQGMSGCINGPIGILSLVLFIMFWVKIANYSAQLSAPDDFSQRELERKLDKFDEGDDDYGRGAPRTDEPPKDDPTRPSPDTYKEGDPGRYQ